MAQWHLFLINYILSLGGARVLMQDAAAHAYDNYKGLTGRTRKKLGFRALFSNCKDIFLDFDLVLVT